MHVVRFLEVYQYGFFTHLLHPTTDALDTAWVNVHKMDVNNVDLVNVDIQSLQLARGTYDRRLFET